MAKNLSIYIEFKFKTIKFDLTMILIQSLTESTLTTPIT